MRDYRTAGLPPKEVALMAFAEKVVLNAHEVTPEDIEGLRSHGFSDTEILDIAMTAAARSFFSKVLDASGAEPEESYQKMEESLLKTLTVGRRPGGGPKRSRRARSGGRANKRGGRR